MFHVEHYDVVVIGAGHAGIEAANISDKYGLKTALITKNYSDLGKLSCNPSIGGVGKTHIASEVDILGGVICKIGDKSAIHYRVLNLSKGPAVWGVRAQIDRDLYSQNMKKFVKSSKIDLIEDEHVKFFKDLLKNNKGDQELVFNVFGNDDGLKVNLNSTKYKVKINQELLKSLKEKKLDFRLN